MNGKFKNINMSESNVQCWFFPASSYGIQHWWCKLIDVTNTRNLSPFEAILQKQTSTLNSSRQDIHLEDRSSQKECLYKSPQVSHTITMYFLCANTLFTHSVCGGLILRWKTLWSWKLTRYCSSLILQQKLRQGRTLSMSSSWYNWLRNYW